jgi:hypothetical protein
MEDFFNVIKQQMPALKSQAQFNAFMASFEALRGLMNAIFAQNAEGENQMREALETSFDAARKITEVTVKLEEVPEAATSKDAEEFKKPPTQFGEYDIQRQLLSELGTLHTSDGLMDWYWKKRKQIDEVVSPTLRNPLLDAIRARKNELVNQAPQGT